MAARGVVEAQTGRRSPSAGTIRSTGVVPKVNAAERRAALLALLTAEPAPHPGDALAERFGVSRQAIVHDIAILRAEGAPVVATVRGYLRVPAAERLPYRTIVAVRHRAADAESELMALVDLGVRVVDVVVEHPLYGGLRGELHLASPADVRSWAEATRRSGAHLLSELTDGVHLHTLEADSEDRLADARTALAAHGYLLDGGEPDS